MCRISFPVCLLKRRFWLPGETVVNFTLSVPRASRRQEALCAPAFRLLSSPPPLPFFLSYPCLNYFFFHIVLDLHTSHRYNQTVLDRMPTMYKTLCELGDAADVCSHLLMWILWSIRQPRHSRQSGDDSFYRGHNHVESKRVICLERKLASPFTGTSLPLEVGNSWGQEAEAGQVMMWIW